MTESTESQNVQPADSAEEVATPPRTKAFHCAVCGNHLTSRAHKESCVEPVRAAELAASVEGPTTASRAANVARTAALAVGPGKPRSRRGQARYSESVLSPLEQIPVVPQAPTGFRVEGEPGQGMAIQNVQTKNETCWAYYLRPEGATIADTLILYPNGGIPTDPATAQKFGVNAQYYRLRQADKGFEYVGNTLDERSVRRLVEILGANREDEILFCEDEANAARYSAMNSDRPEMRDRERKRAAQFEHRLEYLTQPLEPEKLIAELNEIARAQRLASVPAAVLSVMREMIGEVNQNMVAHFARTQTATGDAAPAGVGSLDY